LKKIFKMKKIKFLSILILLSVALFTSCDTEPIDSAIDLNDNGNNSGTSTFKADFNGATWNASTSQAIISGNLIQIAATKTDGSSFGIMISGSSVGTYQANVNILSYNPAGSEYGYWSSNIANPTEDTGSVTITSIDTVNKKISGTFSYKGYWSNQSETGVLPINFTNGVFTNVSYIDQPETGDTFFAKVNGTEFVDVDLLAIEIGVGSDNYISIGAQNSDLNSITVSVKDDLNSGTYPITGSMSTDHVQAIYKVNNVSQNAISGSIIITSKTSTRIKGTFSFSTTGGSYSVTEGAFDVEIP